MSDAVEDLSATYGSMLLGGLVSACLSGVVLIQSLVYYKLFPLDTAWRKLLLTGDFMRGGGSSRMMDIVHTSMVWAGLWVYLIENQRTLVEVDYIPLSISLSIVITAALTFLVHLFFAERIYTRNEQWDMALHSYYTDHFNRCSAARLNTREQLRHIHTQMIDEMDASAIIRDDLRLHFRSPMTQTMNTIHEESMTCTTSGARTNSFLADSKHGNVSVTQLPVQLESVRLRERTR
ncbi:hypothetical protein D9611_005417 [Ephemerocybe angulata]|uniref:Uncharacterized protein n=1 Tax=Ephemerocybe angulata TaxID=980116 RepID=A0A8H5C0I4_9AGAR|nr:hypothetical protein D9611_005417 [Tulosesus angulatus]